MGKRKNLLRTCDALKPVVSRAKCLSEATRVTSEDRWTYLIAKITETEDQRQCRQLMENQHLSCLRRAKGELRNERISGAAMRLQCQIKALAKFSGLPLMTSTEPQQQHQEKAWKQRKSIRPKRNNRCDAMLIPGIDI